MTPAELDAIRARDRDYDDIFEQQAAMSPHIAHRLVAWPVADRRTLLAYVDELRAKLATEVKNKKQFERDWLEACDQVSTLRAELAALREAAGKVIERWDTPLWKDAEPTAVVINGLRKLLAETVDARNG